jgi:hypothetical protein
LDGQAKAVRSGAATTLIDQDQVGVLAASKRECCRFAAIQHRQQRAQDRVARVDRKDFEPACSPDF